ncbi:MAG: TadE/TadG family type IV pilus assembly protein [Achromobacter sp.]|uniref:TadE/TadG family type IV pilus assembly protein n=1 Tax=Achromobacter sp. TaxID=134375 RepID=UPI003D0185BA
MTGGTIGQRGQAMVEALVLLPVLILMLLAIAWTGKVQYRALTLIQSSRRVAMSIAMGVPAGARDTARLQVTDDAAGAGAWWWGPVRRVSATSRADVTGVAAWGGVRLARRLSVAADAGNARDERDTQRRIGASAAAWGRVAADARILARAIAPAIAAVDVPWRRPALSLDWLSSWADVVPADRKADDGSARP